MLYKQRGGHFGKLAPSQGFLRWCCDTWAQKKRKEMIDLKDPKPIHHRDARTPVFTVELFTRAKWWSLPRC